MKRLSHMRVCRATCILRRAADRVAERAARTDALRLLLLLGVRGG